MALYQGLWFCRQQKFTILSYSVLAIGVGALSIYTGISILENWHDSSFCIAFFLVSQSSDPDHVQNCNEQKFAYASFACGGLWILASLSTIAFVYSGNYGVWEKKYMGGNDNDNIGGIDIEMDIDSHGDSAIGAPPHRAQLQKQPSAMAVLIANSIATSARAQEATVDTSGSLGHIPVAAPAYIGSERGRTESYVVVSNNTDRGTNGRIAVPKRHTTAT